LEKDEINQSEASASGVIPRSSQGDVPTDLAGNNYRVVQEKETFSLFENPA